MPIPVSCGQCRASFRVADAKAGHRGRCPHCKAIIAVPAFVPVGTACQDEDDSVDEPRHPMSPAVWMMAGAGLVSAVAAGVYLAAQTTGVAAAWQAYAGYVAAVGACALPLIAPPALARRGLLTMARWLIAAVFFLFLAVLLFGLCYVQYERERTGAGQDAFRLVAGFAGMGMVASLIGVPGCILAAVVHRPANGLAITGD